MSEADKNAEAVADLEKRLVESRSNLQFTIKRHKEALDYLARDYLENFKFPITFERLWFVEERRREREEEEDTVASLTKELDALDGGMPF